MEYYHATGTLYGPQYACRLAPRPIPSGAGGLFHREQRIMLPKKAGNGSPWTTEHVRQLREHSQARTPLTKIAKEMKRTEGALRRKAGILGIGLGHRRYHR